MVLHETQVFPGRDMAESERLAPPDVASTPPDKNSEDLKRQQRQSHDKRRLACERQAASQGPLRVPPRRMSSKPCGVRGTNCTAHVTERLFRKIR